MKNRRLKWAAYFAAPLLLLFPFYNWYTSPLKSIVLHPQKTGIMTLSLLDTERERPLITEVWYPVDIDAPSKAPSGIWLRCEEARDQPLSAQKKKYPLIIMSHGNGGDRFNISWLAEILAANGYIAAAMDHYGNTWNNKIPSLYAKPWERPKDVSFVLDQLLDHPFLKQYIDPNRVGFAGYSLGGATGMWIAGAQINGVEAETICNICASELPDFVTSEVLSQIDFHEAMRSYHDPRFNAVFTMAPALGWLFDEASLKNIKIPICIVSTNKDQVVPCETNASRFAKAIKKASLKILHNDGDHYVFLNRASLVGKRLLEPRFFEDGSHIKREEVHEEVGATAVTFFNEHLKPSLRQSLAGLFLSFAGKKNMLDPDILYTQQRPGCDAAIILHPQVPPAPPPTSQNNKVLPEKL